MKEINNEIHMNAYVHSEISVKNRGGKIEDYYAIHDFMDITKELCSDNRHRVLHTLWGVKRVVIPVFGHTICNADGKFINVKDLCEQDHILPDYRNRFIPTLADFVLCIDENQILDWKEKIEYLHQQYKGDKELEMLLLSPLANTGMLKSLLITHNSWFLNEIVPQIFNRTITLKDFEISPSDFFNAMEFKLWMDNGAAYPESVPQISKLQIIN